MRPARGSPARTGPERPPRRLARVKPLLLVRNDTVDTFGLATSALEGAGAHLAVVDAQAGEALPELDGVSGVVMFGGSMNVDEVEDYPFLRDVRCLTRRAIDERVPYLGICLGGQILTRALEHPVVRAPVRQIGFKPLQVTSTGAGDPLASVFASGDHVFHWHEDMIELPEGAELLASSDAVPVQAYRSGPRAWGFQFHFEVDAEEIELWLEDFRDGLEEKWGSSPERIRAEAAQHLPGQQEKGREVFRRFAAIVSDGDAR